MVVAKVVVMEAVTEASSLEVELRPARRGGVALASASETPVDLEGGAAGCGSQPLAVLEDHSCELDSSCIVKCSVHCTCVVGRRQSHWCYMCWCPAGVSKHLSLRH